MGSSTNRRLQTKLKTQRAIKHRHAKHTRQHKTARQQHSLAAICCTWTSWSGGTRVHGTWDKTKVRDRGATCNGQKRRQLTWGLERCWCCVVHLHLAVKLCCEQQSQRQARVSKHSPGGSDASKNLFLGRPPLPPLLPPFFLFAALPFFGGIKVPVTQMNRTQERQHMTQGGGSE